ncbi:MAG: PAS domain S-box protein [Ignavibacteriae bacterium]|nr:PAS domain S-box protein [Ignavibacteriota bacterium]
MKTSNTSADELELDSTLSNLQTSEAKLKSIFSAAPIGIGMVINRVFEEVNDFFCNMIGYERSELLGKNARIIYPSDEEYNFVGKEKYEQINGKGIGAVNTKFKRKDGKIINVVLSSMPIDRDDYSKGMIFTAEDITDKIRFENELKLSEEKFRKAFITSPDAVNINRLKDGMYLSINDNFMKMTGYKEEEVIGKTSLELNIWNNPEDREKLVNELRTKGFAESLEASFKMKNGNIRFGLMSASIIQLDDVDCILSITRDITDRKIIEQNLKESEENYQQIIHGMRDMVFVIDMNGKIIDSNKSAFETLGYSEKEMLDLHVTDFDNSLSSEEIKGLIERIPFEKSQFFQTNHLSKDKQIIPVEIQSTMITYHGEKAILSIARDLTHRKKIEEKLKISEENFKTFFHNIDLLVFVLNEFGNIIEINETVEKRLGFTKEELLNKSVLEVHPPERKEEVLQIVSDMLEGKRETCPIPLLTKDKKLIPVETHVKKGMWNGKPAIFGITKDISALKLSEDKFAKAFHNNPAISGFSDLDTGKYIEVNKTFYDKLGFSPEEVIGKRASEVVNLDFDFREKTLSELAQNKFVENVESIIHKKDGTPLNVLLNAEIIEIENKKYNYTTAVDITELRKFENNLITSEENLKTFFNNVESFIFILDEDGHIIEINETVKNRLGYSKNELINKHVTFVHPQNRAKEVTVKITEMIEGIRKECLVPFLTKDKKIIQVETHVKRGSWNGKPALFGISKDISDLIVSEQKFARAFHNNPAMSGLREFESDKFVEVNKTFYEKLGFLPEEVLGKTTKEINVLESEFREKYHEILIENKSFADVETIMFTKNRRKLNVLLSAEIIEIEEKKYIYSTSVDITDRKHYEKDLKLSQERYRKFFEDDLTADFLLTPTGEILDCNPAFIEIFGFKTITDSLSTKFENSFFTKKNYNEFISTIEKMKKLYNYELKLKRKDGKNIYVVGNIISEFDEEGKLFQYRGYLRDVTNSKLIEQQLEKYRIHLEDLVKKRTELLEKEITRRIKAETKVKSALEKERELNQLKSTFMSTVSHEFRTPLTSIYSSVELIERYSDKWEKRKTSEHYTRIKNSIEHLTEMLEEVLKLNRSEQSKIVFNPEDTNLETFCKNIAKDFDPILSSSQKLNFKYSLKQKNYFVDRNLLKIILSNLVSNAVKFSPQNGEIDFEVSHQKSKIKFLIKDRGIGISEVDIEKIFNPFYRSNNVSTIAGSGLGLSIAKSYVEIHKGTIEVESKLNKGTTFILLIPIKNVK